MAEDNRVFVDSNYFVALFNPSDALHKRALDLARNIDSQNTFLVISNFVFLEIVTVLSQRRGRKVAIEVGEHLLTNSLITIIQVDELLQRESWHIFQNIMEKNVSFVDSSIVAVMKAEYITKLLTFDAKDFKKLRKRYQFNFYEI
ncbi:MAG: PIN domain-containing protein [Parcubacteria group bacterium]|nr:PIN domain-containing protein [Parcubacteria group bacterium]